MNATDRAAHADSGRHITLEVVSDVVCPWCFIGKRQLDRALALWRAERPDCAVTVRWRPYFLNPDTPESGEPYRPFLEAKFGGPEKLAEIWARVGAAGKSAGIDFAFEKIALRANTLHAHRLIHYAQKVGAGRTASAGVASITGDEAIAGVTASGAVAGNASATAGEHAGDGSLAGSVVDAVVDALFVAQFIDGRHVGDRAVLLDIATRCGLDVETLRAYLASDEDVDTVRAEAEEAQRMGVSGVPFFIFDRRLGASGAQPAEALLQGFRQVAG